MAEMFISNDGPGTLRAKIFRFIVEYKIAHDGCAPSYLEIVEKLHVGSKSTVHYHLRRLAQLGMINFVPGYRRNRTIEIAGGYRNAKMRWPDFFEGEL
jgi:SOS-response transcriptional repressor LexA